MLYEIVEFLPIRRSVRASKEGPESLLRGTLVLDQFTTRAETYLSSRAEKGYHCHEVGLCKPATHVHRLFRHRGKRKRTVLEWRVDRLETLLARKLVACRTGSIPQEASETPSMPGMQSHEFIRTETDHETLEENQRN
jgi:hypothetical protein